VIRNIECLIHVGDVPIEFLRQILIALPPKQLYIVQQNAKVSCKLRNTIAKEYRKEKTCKKQQRNAGSDIVYKFTLFQNQLSQHWTTIIAVHGENSLW
jgi:hypothetical protein